jgi:hypothetical protein
MAENKELTGPDFARGISLTELTDGSMVQGHVKGEPILVAQRGDNYFARSSLHELDRLKGKSQFSVPLTEQCVCPPGLMPRMRSVRES